jgi:2-oxoisovalerate dehydrogenase E2 component (dihydrolipoyl transacylase)
MKTFTLPDLGEGLQDAEIVDWHVAVGDHVIVDQPLVSVETDKAVVEVPSPFSGRVANLHAKAGDIVKIGQPLADFADGVSADKGTVVGRVPGDTTEAAKAPSQTGERRASIKATPAVRALARELGVDLLTLDPTGPSGAITAEDVKRSADSLSAADAAEPLRGVRRAMAHKMAQAHSEVVPASIHDEAEVEDWRAEEDVTIRLIRAIAAGCRASPILNASYDSQTMSLRSPKRIDLGIAVDTEDGLFVPVMRDIANRDAADLRRGLDALKRDIAARQIPLEEMRGATISLSNFGVFGAGRFANMVIIPPQVAIVGAGIVGPRVVPRNGKADVRRTLPLSLTFDHRVVAGSEAIRFLKAMLEDLERP